MTKLQTTNHKLQTPVVGIIMGSDSDLPVMQAASDILKEFDIPHEVTVVSAHRTPHRMIEYAQKAKERGLKVIIAGARNAVLSFWTVVIHATAITGRQNIHLACTRNV